MAGRSCYRDVLPFTAMVTMKSTNFGLNILFKSATLRGMSNYVFIVYSSAFATVLLLPFPFVFPSRTMLPPFQLSYLLKAFLLGLIGFVGNVCAYKGLAYSSPTLASAISNLTRAFLSYLLSSSGALVVVLYEGPTVLSTTSKKDWVKGSLLLSVGNLLFSASYILQTHIIKTYQGELVLALLYNMFGTIVSAPLCVLTAETNISTWKLRPGIALAAIIYSGIFGSALSTIVENWCLNLKGPVVIGAVMISIGFYAVIWRRANEEEKIDQDYGFDSLRESHSGEAPLLETYKA